MVAVIGVAVAKLRGVRESGRLFALPTCLIKGAMLFRRRVIVADVPYHLT